VSIENRDLKPGTKLTARYKGQEHTAEVVKTGDGIRYRLADGKEYKSPSSAGSALMGGSACNGWRFWSLAGVNGETPAKKPRTARAKKASGFKQLDDGRFWCSGCQDAFEAPKGVTPIGCPQGHSPE
jgi:Restriction Enzyme Adenine Methylase Associated/Protein of unknown function (DUF2924)